MDTSSLSGSSFDGNSMSRRLKRSSAPRWARWTGLVLLGLVVIWGQDWLATGALENSAKSESSQSSSASSGDQRIDELFEDQRSDVMVTVEGIIDRVLEDDKEGSRHQRFIVRLGSRRTLLVAHNIDLADRVPLAQGDAVVVRGEYEWNDRGGLLHWTHHDPGGRRPGGWIEFNGTRYR